MIRRPTKSTRPYTLLPNPTLFRSDRGRAVPPARRLTAGRKRAGCHRPAERGQAPNRCPDRKRIRLQWRITGQPESQCLRNVHIRHGPAASVLPPGANDRAHPWHQADRSEEHTSELQSLMRISYAVFCLKKKNNNRISRHTGTHTERARITSTNQKT